MSNISTSHSVEDEDDWTVLSSQDAPIRESNTPTKNVYLDFQLRTMFGTFHYTSRQLQKNLATTPSEVDESINSQHQSRLFQLPVELRLSIYEHIFRIPTGSSCVQLLHRPAQDRATTSLTVLLTCRRVLAEAGELFYTLNRISVEDSQSFLAHLGPKRRAAVTAMTLEVRSAASTYTDLQQLHGFANLKSLYLRRTASIRFQNPSTWAVMAPQLSNEIGKMTKLQELKILTPEARDMTESEMARKKRLEEIDARIVGAVGSGRSGADTGMT